MRILLVEDEPVVAQGVCLSLRSSRAIIDQSETGEEAIQLAHHYDYDIILLDLMLPDMDGFEVLRRMRAMHIMTPVLIISGLTRPDAKVKAFGVGADDFITKPIDKGEMLARVQAIVRRIQGYSAPTIQIGPLTLCINSKEVTVNGTPLRLTAKEYAILELLVLRNGMVLTKDTFLNHLYGGIDEPEMKIVDVFICKLRKKLVQAGCPNFIETVWGRGYRAHDPKKDTATIAAAPLSAAPAIAVPAIPATA
jgi:two-component system cell cycle response regulator CtrA